MDIGAQGKRSSNRGDFLVHDIHCMVLGRFPVQLGYRQEEMILGDAGSHVLYHRFSI